MTMPGIFIVGTDTGVGKTRVASLVVRSLKARGCRVGALKPVATGAYRASSGELTSEDTEQLLEALADSVERKRVTPFFFEAPVAPCLAARTEGKRLEAAEVEKGVFDAVDWWSGRADLLVVEGVGGLLCPLAEGTTIADLAVALDFPIVIVARRSLGTLNHTLLTIEAARSRDLRIAGLILNGTEPTSDPRTESTNAEELSRRCPGVTLLDEIAYQQTMILPESFHNVDWMNRARAPRFRQ